MTKQPTFPARTGLAWEVIDSATADELAQQATPCPPEFRVLAEAAALEQVASRRLRETVGYARRNGATWQQVGDALGVSRQAAQQRFGRG